MITAHYLLHARHTVSKTLHFPCDQMFHVCCTMLQLFST